MVPGSLGRRVAAATDQLGRYPREVTGEEESSRRVDKALRFVSVGLAASLLLNVSQTWLVASMLPLREIVPLLMTISNKTDSVVLVEPPKRGQFGAELMTEKLVMDYVRLRNEILLDTPTMSHRWGPGGEVQHMSSMPVYSDFIKEMAAPAKEAERRGITRTVRMLADGPTKIEQGYYQVEFETIDVEGRSETRKQWVASLAVRYEGHEVAYQERYMNPLGLIVTQYSVAQKAHK